MNRSEKTGPRRKWYKWTGHSAELKTDSSLKTALKMENWGYSAWHSRIWKLQSSIKITWYSLQICEHWDLMELEFNSRIKRNYYEAFLRICNLYHTLDSCHNSNFLHSELPVESTIFYIDINYEDITGRRRQNQLHPWPKQTLSR